MSTFSTQLFDPHIGFNRHRPLFGWTMAFVFGTGLGYFFGGAWGWLIMATAAMVVAWRAKPEGVATWVCLACLALAGWRSALLHDRNEAVLTQLKAYQASAELFDLKVTVSNDRQIVQRKRGGPYCRFSADDAWLPDGSEVHGTNLLVYYYDRNGNFPKTGETWLLKAKLRANSHPQRMSLSARGETAQHLPQEDQRSNVEYVLAHFRNRLADHLALGVNEAQAVLTQTMVLGTRARLPYQLRQRYADAGIAHIFAISGLHVGIIAGLLVWLIAWGGVRLRMRIWLLLPALLGYLLLTGVPPSATRACLMALMYCFAPTLLRRPDGASALFVTAAIVLVVEPGWIANAGALLSFCVMGGLFLLTKPFTYFINRFLGSPLQRTPLGEMPLERPWHVAVRQYLALLIALSCAAWLSVLPLCLYFFGRVSLVGLLLNLIVPSVTMIVVWTACLSAFCGFLLPALSAVMNRFNAFLLSLVDRLAHSALEIPGAVWELEHQPGVTVSLLMGAALIVFGLWLGMHERRCRQADPLDPENFNFFPRAINELAPRETPF